MHGRAIVSAALATRTYPRPVLTSPLPALSYLPVGTVIYPSFYAIHRDPRNFSPNPDTFWPDRWLIAAGLQPYDAPADGAPFVHDAQAFLPFSFGPANCVGKALAMAEMRTVLARLLQRVQLRPAEGWDPAAYEGAMQEWLVITKPPLPVTVELREGHWQ